MSVMDNIFTKAKANKKRIVLPESEDIRILTAAAESSKQGIADIVLLGDPEQIKSLSAKQQLDISNCEIINIEGNERLDKFSQEYYELRKHKGMTLEQAQKDVLNPVYFACMLVKTGEADAVVSGAVVSTAQTLSPALRIIRTAPKTKLVSSFFIMQVPNTKYGEAGIFAFADCGMVENPDAEQLSEVAVNTADSFKALTGIEPKVALLSYSTKGSAQSLWTEKVIAATKIAQAKRPDLSIDGELQADAAIDSEIASRKAPGSPVAGQANVLVFPDLNSGNIAYKLVQRLAGGFAFGPITQGLAKPVNDLSRGSTVEDIMGVIAITAVQAGQDD